MMYIRKRGAEDGGNGLGYLGYLMRFSERQEITRA